MVTVQDIRTAARAAREPQDIAMSADAAEWLANHLQALEALADTARSFVASTGWPNMPAPGGQGRAVWRAVWGDEEIEGLAYLAAALERVNP
jgi:hypothetical protein